MGVSANKPGKILQYIDHPENEDISIIQTSPVTGPSGFDTQVHHFQHVSAMCNENHGSPVGSTIAAHFAIASGGKISIQMRRGGIVSSDTPLHEGFLNIYTDINIIVGNSGGPVVLDEGGAGRVAAMLHYVQADGQFGKPVLVVMFWSN